MCYFSIDEEGDKVTISSDDELVSALMFVKRKDDEPFRLIIQTSGGPKPETNSATSTATTGNCQGEIHWGVTCDGCQGAVKGFRYKCFQCPDFDLCGKCETAGMHPGHPLIRVTGPMVIPQQLELPYFSSFKLTFCPLFFCSLPRFKL